MKSITGLMLLYLLINLHLLRNVSGIYLLLVVAFYCLLFINLLTKQLSFQSSNKLLLTYILFFFGYVYVALISFPQLDMMQFTNASLRFFFTLPFGILVYFYVKNEDHIRKLLLLTLVIIAIGCLSIPLQVITGPIHWFTEASQRGGLARLGSLFGNLTAIGIVGGIGLVIALFIKCHRIIRVLAIISIICGLIFSLQKAAIMNIIFALFIYLLYSPVSVIKKVRIAIISIPIMLILIIGIAKLVGGNYLDTVLANVLGITLFNSSVILDDFSLLESIKQRIIIYPTKIFENYGIQTITTGIGYIALGGTLGLDGIMSHNTLFDVLYSGGFLFFTVFACLMILTYINLNKKFNYLKRNNYIDNNLVVLRAVLTIFIINLPFSSGMLIQPNISTVFWMIVGLSSGHYYKKMTTLNLKEV